jgi:AraC-like DNA-binding protein
LSVEIGGGRFDCCPAVSILVMGKTHEDLTETHVLGAKTSQIVVRVDDLDTREWLASSRKCSALAQHRIAHLGVASAVAPYAIVRKKQSGTYFMACFGGEGRILVDGRWMACKAGMACLLPPHMLNAFHCVPGKTWEFVWVRYQALPELRPIVSAGSPVLAKFNAEPLRLAVLGLHAECGGAVMREHGSGGGSLENGAVEALDTARTRKAQRSHTPSLPHSTAPVPAPSPAALHHWVELIQTYVLRFAQPWRMDERLSLLWERVAERLHEEWTLGNLAKAAHMSEEHLRRLCTQQLGRSPMRQVTYLRMRRAAELLATTNEKIESIAGEVGYQNPFVFSTTFKKWIGWRPSEHRVRK